MPKKGDLFEERTGLDKSWVVDVSGIYVIEGCNTTKAKKYYKVGLTTNMYRRLQSYHICFWKGFNFINLALFDEWPKNKEKQKPIRKKLREIEKRVHELLVKTDKVTRVGLDASKSSEWFEVPNRRVITQAIQKAYREWMVVNKKSTRSADNTLHTNKLSIPTLITDLKNTNYEKPRP